MHPFRYIRPSAIDAAIAASTNANAKFLAGGTNLIDLMKGGVERPEQLVDINRLPLAEIEALADGRTRIGALARMSDVADHALIRTRYPLLAQALVCGATPQLRNAATVGGNLLQRTRCHYFYDTAFRMCNKRDPGSGCAALEGHHRMHAVLGASEQCIATHPSDMAVALAALDADVRVRGSSGERTVPLTDFYRLPDDRPDIDTHLAASELIVALELPAGGFAAHSHYLKVRDRASFAFALVSVAAAVELDDGRVREARIALGGVAHKPWRAFEAERVLAGRRAESASYAEAAEAAVKDAKPRKHNAFKVELVKRAVARALQVAAGTRA